MKPVVAFIVTILVCVASTPAIAHHSTSAEFDLSKTVAITGTICSAEFSNPHSYVYVHVKLPKDQTETWKLEMLGASRMTDQGVPRETFKPGESITIQAYPSKKQAFLSDPAQRAVYGACTDYPANALRVGHVREATLTGGKQIQFSDDTPGTVTIRR
jgi:hypothetical protein